MKATLNPRLRILLALAALGAAPTHAVDLYKEDQYRALVSDLKARRIGDSLTVLVVENASAAATADTNSKRKTDAGVALEVDVGSTARSGDINLAFNNDFSGVARTQRAGKLLAQITVTVTGVEPNGDLRIAGERLLEVNSEQQLIRLEGRVRPQDIGENNTIVSQRIADAKIHYAGAGVIADGQQPGWFNRLLTWLGM
jgi:flagellar L-ring protein FlgH